MRLATRLVIAILIFGSAAAIALAAEKRPNILVVLTDDKAIGNV